MSVLPMQRLGWETGLYVLLLQESRAAKQDSVCIILGEPMKCTRLSIYLEEAYEMYETDAGIL